MPAFSPLLPPGSLIYSAAVIAQRFGGYPSKGLAVDRVYGHRKGIPSNFFGAGANKIARSSTLIPSWSGSLHLAKYECTVRHFGNSPGSIHAPFDDDCVADLDPKKMG